LTAELRIFKEAVNPIDGLVFVDHYQRRMGVMKYKIKSMLIQGNFNKNSCNFIKLSFTLGSLNTGILTADLGIYNEAANPIYDLLG
jgi:hypothetical protein